MKATMTRIDTHQHFWTFQPANYGWIDESMASLRRDFGPPDLEPELRRAQVSGTLLVEARGHLDETENLLRIAASTPFVRGVVGWLPLAEQNAEAALERYAAEPLLRGVRHWLGAASDTHYMFDAGLNRGVARLRHYGLAYDLMLWPPQLAAVARFVDAHPEQIFVLDHFAKPMIRSGGFEPWRTDLADLARRPNVYCKISGLATEADRARWTLADLQPYLDTALEAFTPQRLMFGSDWPVCTLATRYERWTDTLATWLAALSPSEQARIWGGTAVEAYQLGSR